MNYLETPTNYRTPDTIHVWSLSSDPDPLLRAYNLKVQNFTIDSLGHNNIVNMLGKSTTAASQWGGE